MDKRPLIALVIGICLLTAGSLPASADGFPGKGSNEAWSNALPYYNQGNRYLARGDFDWAENRYRDAIAIYADDPDFYVNLGIALRKQGKYAESEEAFKKAAAINPKDWAPWSNLANVYVKQDKLIESLDLFKKTLTLNPPLEEKTVIEGQIRDITKILRVTGKLPAADAGKGGKNAKATSAGAKSAKAENVGKLQSKNAKPQQSEATASVKASGTTNAGSVDSQSIKGSGWDYVYGH